PGVPSKVDTLLGEMEATAPAETIAARTAEIRQTEKRFGLGPVGEGGYRVVVPANGVAEDRAVPPTLEEFQEQLRPYARTDPLAPVAPPPRRRRRAGRPLPPRPGAARRRRRARASTGGRARAQPRRAGRVQPGLETRGRDRRLGPRRAARHVPHGTAPGRRRR